MGQPVKTSRDRVLWGESSIVVHEGATKADMTQLCVNLRREDEREILAWGLEPMEAIELSCRSSSKLFTVLVDGRVALIFGAGPKLLDGKPAGAIWMLSTSLLEKFGQPISRHARRWIGELQREYSILWNEAHRSNDLHIRWIKWLGFEVVAQSQPKHFVRFVRSPSMGQ
jgi:hypothetical protein